MSKDTFFLLETVKVDDEECKCITIKPFLKPCPKPTFLLHEKPVRAFLFFCNEWDVDFGNF